MKLADLGVETVQLEISTLCNIRCTFCPIDVRGAPPAEFMPLEKVRRVLDDCARDGSLRFVGFQHLNEPLLHPKIGAILDYAHALGLRTYLCTNGTILTPRTVDLLARTSPTRLKVSVQDVNPHTFNRVKGTRVDFVDFQHRVAALVERRLTDPGFTTRIEIDVAVPHLRTRRRKLLGLTHSDKSINDADATLARYLEEFLRTLESLAPSAKIDWSTFAPDLRHIKTFRPDYVPTTVIGPGVTLELKGFFDWLGIEGHRPVRYGACPRLVQLVINYRGELQLCCVDTSGKTSVGNVLTESLGDIIARPDALAKLLRAPGYELPTEHCRRCMGAPTRRGVAVLNVLNRVKHGHPAFVPEANRGAPDALRTLRAQEAGEGHERVVRAIDESLACAATSRS
jgi:MoaA/NifB/PqqE/SkfB family radical SAM enzyme